MGRLIDAEIAEKRIASLIELIDETCKDVRERHGGDDVCGLCEYDGATQGESGDWYPECPGFETDECFCLRESLKQRYLEQIPAVDAVEVVRCGKCKRWMKDVPGCTKFIGRCEFANYMIGSMGFCSYGERRNNEQES